MKFMKTGLVLAGLALVLNSCSKDEKEKIDEEYPIIELSAANAFPKQCSVVKRGEKFTFRAKLSDNAALGAVSVDVHHNFDHHSHSTEVNDCQSEAAKTPVKPFLLIKSFTIPSGLSSYEVAEEITVPADVDPGDYHFLIRLTDQAGWQTIRGISIKIQ